MTARLPGRPAVALVVAPGVLTALALGACSAPVARSTPPSTTVAVATSTTATAPTWPAVRASDAGSAAPTRPAATGDPVVSRLVTAGGVRQWVHCAGPGPLTLVVIPGLGADATDWAGVLPGLQHVVRTCVYDRPGLGRSPARPDPTQTVDAGLLAGELWAALAVAGERGPYLVLGHSFGGLIARTLVAEHRAQVRGMLLAESVTPYDPTTGRYWTEAGHRVDLLASSAQTRGGPHVGNLPLVVLSASRPDEDHLGGPTYGQPAWMTALWVRQQSQDLSLSSDAIQVTARSGHVLQQDAPGAVVEAVRELVTSVHRGSRLACAPGWTATGATCR